MRRNLKAGSTSITLPIRITDTSSSIGAGLGSLVFNSAGLTADYRREGQSSYTPITLVTATLGTWTSGGFIADGTRGGYELGLPNAAMASGAKWVVIRVYGATNAGDALVEISLEAVDNQNVTTYGLANLDAAISSRSTYAGGAVASVTGAVGSVTAGVTVATNNDKTGYSLSATQTFNMTGNLSGSVGSVTGAVGSVTGNVGGNILGGMVGNVVGSVGSVSSPVTVGTNNDKTGYSLATAPPTAAAIATQVLSTPVPGSFTSGQAGYVLGNIATGTAPSAATIVSTLLGSALGSPTVQTGVTSGWTVQEALLAALGSRYWPEETTGTSGTGTYVVKNVNGVALQTFITDLDSNGNPIKRRLS